MKSYYVTSSCDKCGCERDECIFDKGDYIPPVENLDNYRVCWPCVAKDRDFAYCVSCYCVFYKPNMTMYEAEWGDDETDWEMIENLKPYICEDCYEELS